MWPWYCPSRSLLASAVFLASMTTVLVIVLPRLETLASNLYICFLLEMGSFLKFIISCLF